ncbi:hypothetical protein RND81_12G183200 [Saponaria officinalis]|uniref:Leucine-rich repeat-containing N-terminal plant-type domain-containing protein n=2 Tax=Saponaria officinalis TaxID=3572 RepID=A0AAW1HCC9_SAPOF
MRSGFWCIAILVTLTTVVNACLPSDRAALMSIKAALNEPYLGIFKSWTGPDCCQGWYGVTCDDTRRVAEINLRGESEDPIFEQAHRTGFMTGSISPAICKLDRLSTLTIADWKGISGVIPECITNLLLLHHLDIVGNKISGKIPNHIGQLKELTVINLADNLLTGPIPPSIVNLGRLMHLDLRNNKLSGELPSELGCLKMLSRALLSGNQLGGPIPASLSDIYRLSDLDLSLNRLSGEIPDVFDKMPVLSTLNLDGNMISGQLPQSLLKSSVSILNLSRNALEGRLPDMFGPRSYFTALDLSYNRLSGPIPKSISTAAYIGHLDLSHNHLCGPIPSGSPFDHLEAASFAFNTCLCGKPLGRC